MISFDELAQRPAANLHLHQLAYLREVDRRGSLSRAADALHLSQSALSQSLAELERRLDTVLFERAGRGRRLTPEGREVLAFAERVLAGAEELQQRLNAGRRGEAGVLRIGMIDAATLYVLPDIVRRFREAYPAVELKVAVATSGAASDSLLAGLRALDLDLVFVVGPVDGDDLVSVEQYREPLHIYAPDGDERDPNDVDWALYPEGSRTRAMIDAGLAALHIHPRVTLESGNPQVLRQVAALGLGWTVLPPAVAEQGSPIVGLRRGPLVGERSLVSVHRAARLDPRVEAFLTLARSTGSGRP